ncbi:RNA polymerase sigma factor [Microbacterium sp. ASV49]|uniref:RNA polymerase sigma factor n=1 Tax=Microbacterium candidum TaxID=3041922 RepID=A0ABT7MZZ7_9MICO|nr:RNA polymerase sigma factor [Microbacterium sp. ASV49]MDL9980030.1 RNA polymerase sigma factor [Microbacterium sp. ASV49]
MPIPLRSDAELTALAGGGSELAFREIYRAYAKPVYWLAHGIVGNASDAEDVLQETFLVAWRKLPGFALAGDSLLPWLATICRFQAANRLRTIQRERRRLASDAHAELVPAPIDVAAQVADTQLVELILAEVQGLGELDREIFRLCAAEGYGYQAAADTLGVSHGVVRNRLSRIRTRLRATAREGS